MKRATSTSWKRRFRLVTAVIVLLGLAGSLPALAAVNNINPGDTVAGVVAITETGATGGNAGCGVTTSPGALYSRVEVHRLAGDVSVEEVFTETNVGKGAWTAEWETTGLPNGAYRILSFNRNASGTSGCTLLAETIASDLVVQLENAAVAVADLPETHVTGEPLVIPVVSQDEATGEPLPNHEVTVEVDGLDPQTDTTDDDGAATFTFELPDLPVGTLEVSTSAAADPGFLVGRDTEDEIELLSRTTQLAWTGDTQSLTSAPANLAARIVDATPESSRFGDPVPDLEVTLAIGDDEYVLTSDADGRVAQVVNLGAPERQIPASVTFDGDDVYTGASESFVFLVTDGPPAPAQKKHGLLGGVTRLLVDVVRSPSTVLDTVTDVTNNLLPTVNLGDTIDEILDGANISLVPLQDVDAIIQSNLGPVLDTVAELGDLVDPVVDSVLDELGAIEGVGELVNTLRYQYQTVYVRPDGTSLTGSYPTLLGVPTPLDVTGDLIPDVTANLTLALDTEGPGINGLPVTPVIDVIKLPGAPASLPLAIQAVLAADGLVSLGDGGRVRIGYDARTTSAPQRATLGLGFAAGGFDLDLTTRGAQDLAIVGAFEGGGFDLGFGAPADPSDVGAGETRFGLSLSPAPRHTRIGLGIGGGSAGLGVNFTTSSPSDIGLTFAQDSGGGVLTGIQADFETVMGNLSLVLDAGSSSGGPVPELGLQLLSDNGLDRVYVQSRSYAGGQITDDLLLSLTDVPSSVAFGVGDDGGLALTASAPIGLMEAGFASGGAIATLDEPAYLYLLSNDGYESVGIRLPGVTSLSANLSNDIGLDLEIAPTKLRAIMDTAESSMDAAIYDVPAQFSLGLASDGAFLIQGSAPIDLITLTMSDSSGALMGAESITARIEDIPGLLAITLVGEAISFDTGGEAVGLLELVVGDAPPFVPGEDSLVAEFGDDGVALAVRVHGLRTINANLDLTAPEFLLDTVANAILNISFAAEGLNVAGRIDRLQPNMVFGVVGDEDGNLTGLSYKADAPSNSIFFDVPGLASFTVFDPLPEEFVLEQPPAPAPLKIAGSEPFTLQLAASFDGLSANINSMRIRHMEFAGVDLFGEEGPPVGQEGYQAFFLNTTEVSDDCPDGCVYTMGDATRSLATFNAGAAGPLVSGAIVLGPFDVVPGLVTNGLVTLTPRGLGATDATVTMNVVQSGLSATATHVNTDGDLHCAGTTTAGTNMITTALILGFIPITIQMRNALCGGTTNRADLAIASIDAPTSVVAGEDIVHTVTARNVGPNDANGVSIEAAYEDTLGDPGATCAGATVNLGSGTITCTWVGNTARDGERQMTLTFPTDPSTPPGTSVSVDYTASSTTFGNSATASATSTVFGEVADLSIDVDAPAAAVAGEGDVVHTVTVSNAGPSAADDLQVSASANDALGAPSVSCSDDGVADGTACSWPGATPAGAERTMELTFSVPAGTPTGTLVVDYEATSATAGSGDSTSAATEIATAVANLTVVENDAPSRVSPGDDLVHSVTVRNDGPSPAQTVRVLADHSAEVGVPTITCSAGGVASHLPELQRARCHWFGTTELGAERTITLAWTAPADAALGSTVTVAYRATSDTPGADALTTTATQIDEAAALELTALNAPEVWSPPTSGTAAANNLVHSVVATNNGGPAADVEIQAALPADGIINNPTVACGSGGTGSILDDPEVADDTRAQCVWGATAGGQSRTMTLTWNVVAVNGARNAAAPDDPIIDVGWELSSADTGVVDTASTSTTLLAAVSNLVVSGGTGPASLLTNQSLTHSASVRTTLATAPNLTIEATYDEALGTPTPTCASSTGGIDTSEPGVVRCTWATTTVGTATANTRTLQLVWSAPQVGAAGIGTFETSFMATSDNPGTPAGVVRSTEVLPAAADMAITGVSAPNQVVAGTQLVQHLDARNVGSISATNMRLQAAFADELGAPTVTCGGHSGTPVGTPTATSTTARCQWTGASTVNNPRRMTLTWNVAPTQAPTVLDVDYLVDSDTAGTTASISTSTSIVTQADLALEVAAPATSGPGTLSHVVDVSAAPSAADGVRVEASDNEVLGTATVTCSDDGVAVGVGCEWPTSVVPGAPRTAQFDWTVPVSGSSGDLDVSYAATSTSTGAPAAASASTSFGPLADLSVVSLTAPATVAAAAPSVVHTLVGGNGGPSPATSMQLSAVHNGVLGSPSVVCSAGGTVFAGPNPGQIRCVWFGTTNVGTNRTMTLTWANGEVDDELEVDYSVTSATNGAAGAASATTKIT